MKINKSTQIIGENVILVPYKKHHVLRYHEWMKSEELQHLTASEPLSLEDEYKMQQSWFEDSDKCTFIILSKSLFESTGNEIEAMIGDTNLFLNDPDDKECAEIEIMIAETTDRGKGFGLESVYLMLQYGIEKLDIKKYSAKISMDNQKSISMFTKLGFKEISRSEVFQEITLERIVDNEWRDWLKSRTLHAIINENYELN
ncbi:N-acetyltransferase 9-like protein isoform X2 [Nasonia vitripennis]|uniref:N-acetyltransferase domain-containing protein n=1 Tax=Nasonia vitripennis TaxID=7425 RepID=A0A7M7G782_NASVI|nr:N-acetyltransferase 9-like protein isoform X2 [Nasonia vitripennis]